MNETKTAVSFRHRLEYAGVRAISLAAARVPARWGRAAGRALGRLARRLDRRHAAVAREALTRVYGREMSSAEIERLLTDIYAHMGQTFLEFVQAESLRSSEILARVNTSALDPIADHVNRGRPVIAVLSHYGNWELLALAGGARMPTLGVARRLDNPLLDRLLMRIRRRTGVQFVTKNAGLRPMLRWLKTGIHCCFLIDQDAGNQGVWTPFFGRPASTHDTPVQLALKYGYPLYALGIHCLPDGVHHQALSERVVPEVTGDLAHDVRVTLARCNRILEDFIRRDPAQWFGWLHRRWKTRPPADELILDADGNRVDDTEPR